MDSFRVNLPPTPTTSSTNVDIESHPDHVPPPVTVQPNPVLPEIQNNPRNIPLTKKLLAFFGFGQNASHARKSLVSMLWNVSWGFVQVSPSPIVFLFIETVSQVHWSNSHAVSSQL